MANLRKDRSGDWILRYHTAGAQAGRKRAYHALGPVTHVEAKEQAGALTAASGGSERRMHELSRFPQ